MYRRTAGIRIEMPDLSSLCRDDSKREFEGGAVAGQGQVGGGQQAGEPSGAVDDDGDRIEVGAQHNSRRHGGEEVIGHEQRRAGLS